MYKTATVGVAIATVVAPLALFAQNSSPSAPSPSPVNPWRQIGNALIDRSLAGLATGPVDRVWYTANGLMVRTYSGKIFATNDFETWQPASGSPPAAPAAIAAPLPEDGAQTRLGSSRLYAFARFVYSSENGGTSWDNLTDYRNISIIGNNIRDLAVSPSNDADVTVATTAGVFRTVDGGKSWSGLNQGLPNLPAARLLALPSGDQGVRIALRDTSVVEWDPGQKQAWLPAQDPDYSKELSLRQALSGIRNLKVTAIAMSADTIYLGTADGRLFVSTDGGKSFPWAYPVTDGGPIERFWVDPADSRIAIATVGSRLPNTTSSAAVHVLRTISSGAVWDDMTGNLGDTPVHGVTADRESNAVYVATGQGVFYASTNLEILGEPVAWTLLSGLPQGAADDVRLDDGANQLWAAIDGYGVYSTLAPHRFNDPRVVSAADFVARAAAPGSLVSIVGARITAAQAGNMPMAVLAATDSETQIQIPFDARGSSLSLAVSTNGRNVTLPSVPLEAAAPAIFVAPDGSPMLYDADSGVMLDAMTPAHSRSHIQILATGLGRVTPDWPTGIAATVDNPPKVAATVNAWLDRQPVEVTKAVLAPYVGYYLVEIEVPKIINYGPAELYIDIGGQASNRVRVYIEP